nr:AI-2E family transporter [Bacillus sp. FJAT-47783]
MLVLIIYFSTKITFLFKPIVIFATTLFFPILISGFLYFLLNPVVVFFERRRVPRTLAILLLYVLFISVVSLIIGSIGPTIVSQFNDLIENMPTYIAQSRTVIEDLYHSTWFQWVVSQELISLDKIENTLTSYVSTITQNVSQGFQVVFGVIANITLIIVTVPFVLFYMFKDGEKFPQTVVKFFPKDYRHEVLRILKETGETLSTYIRGQMTVSLGVGILVFIGFVLIKLPYALLLALVIAVTNIIPYLGPFLGAIPAVIVGLLDSPAKALIVIIVITIVQQIDGNIMSPLIIGKRLDTHPLTIIILLLVAGNIAGVLGMILAVPTYAVSKTIIINLYRLIRLRQDIKTE